MSRSFGETPSGGYVPPLLISLSGPPGGGKSKSSLRMGDGMARVRGGPVVLIDTEAGRALKYKRGPHNPDGHEFIHVTFSPPFKPEDFLDAIRQQLGLKPACIIVDSMSDEHVGEGGYLDWHDQEVPKSGGNEWAAWNKPSRSRQRLINGLQQITVPLIFTFRAKEKTKQVGRKVENIGLQPVAPMELVHTMDLACIIPARANGVPLWSSNKIGEDFVIKLPEFLSRFIERGAPLDERLGEALSRWQLGENAPPASGDNGEKRKRTPAEMADAYVSAVNALKTLDELRDYQLDERRAGWLATMKAGHPAIFDRIVEANSKRAAELTPREEEEEGEGPDDSQRGETTGEDDDRFPSDDDQFPGGGK